MKKIFTIICACCLIVALNTQAQRTCSSSDMLHQELAADPERADRLQQIEKFTNDYILNHPDNDRAVVTIPVVFHVVYNTAAQNISDAQCQAQINQLNLDYARLNADASGTPSAFQGVAVNTNVQFCLAQRTPGGAATTGVERRSTTKTSFTDTGNPVKSASTGGMDAWDRNSYLNIWTCNLSGGLLGYAQFPGGSASTDGVVLLYSSIGSVAQPGTATPYHLGRTATHEVGHWLNLYHIWGDDANSNGSCSSSECNGSDNVSDTPNQGEENYGAPTYPRVDCCSPSSPGVMFMNYMDYTDDGAMNMFTAGQSSRMNALFATGGSRVSLKTSLGCQPPGAQTCGTPASLNATSITTSSALLSWGSVSGATSYNLQYKTTAASTFTTVNTASTSYSLSGLASGTTYNYQVQAVCTSTGAYSTASSFTTTTSTGGCSNNYESNNTTATATAINTGTNINSMIGTTTDVDYFTFTTTSAATKVKINLSTLPFDYDVRLYKGTTSVGLSQNGGTTSEQIIYNSTTAGTYYVRVYGYNGAMSTSSCYTLNASVSSSSFREMYNGNTVEVVDGNMTVYPNPTTGKISVDYTSDKNANLEVRVFDMLGRDVYSMQQEVYEGTNTFGMNVNDLSNGVYFIHVMNGDQKHVQRFVVQH